MRLRTILVKALAVVVTSASLAGAAPIELVTNGDFETGSFTGWTVTDQAGGSGNWFIDTPGSSTPMNGLPTAANPAGGSFYAVTDQGGPWYALADADHRRPRQQPGHYQLRLLRQRLERCGTAGQRPGLQHFPDAVRDC